jgi:hypothetical protein
VNQRILLTGVISFLLLGAVVGYYGYYTTLFPANQAMGFIIRAQSAQTPEQFAEYVGLTKALLPKEGNPVWLFPTIRTDFVLIQSALDDMLVRAEALESMGPHSASYNIAMMDMHRSADGIETNLVEAIPYMYISFGNVVTSAIWVAVIIAIFAAMRRANSMAKARLEQRAKTVSGQIP